MKYKSKDKNLDLERNSRVTNRRESAHEKHHQNHYRSNDMRSLESEKNREISLLQKKIIELEKESMKMKTKLTAMDN